MTTPLWIEPLRTAPDTTVLLPGSKSLTNRALLVAAHAEGTSTLRNVLLADDTHAMLDALAALGVRLDFEKDEGVVRVGGSRGSPRGDISVDARQAGTTARFLLPALAAREGISRIDGAPQLRSRPMAPLLEALRQLGAAIDEEGDPGHLPVRVTGPARGGRVDLPGDTSSQFLSGLLMAGPLFGEGVEVRLTSELVSRPYVDLTIGVMRAFGATVERDGDRFTVPPGAYRACDYRIEPDASSASYFFAAAAVTGGRVRVEGLGSGSVQGDLAFVDVLASMGARVRRSEDAVEVSGAGRLSGIDADLRDISDTAPTLAVVAPFADTPTRVRGIGFIRGKESDRVAAIVRELRRCGVGATEEPDGFVVHPGEPHAATIETYDDHRIAMSFALLGLRTPGIEITNPGCVTKTFPEFFRVLEDLRG